MSLKNKFGWSLSRESLFDSCMKKYYFHYYFSWNGWRSQAPEIKRQAFLLKRLVSLPLWRGQLVHYITTKVLQSMRIKGKIPEEKKVIEYADERFEKQFEFSKQKRYLDSPKKSGNKLNIDWLALFDHEYGIRIPPERREKTKSEVLNSLGNLLESDLLKRLTETDPSEWIIEDIDMSEFAQNFSFKGARVFVKTDFIFRSPDNRLNIVDWKTFKDSGKREERETDQLGVYGYYAASEMNEPSDNITLIEVNLMDNASEQVFRLNGELIDKSRNRIEKGIEKLSSVLVKADIEKNEPLPSGNFTPDPGEQCRYCNFRKICGDAAGRL